MMQKMQDQLILNFILTLDLNKLILTHAPYHSEAQASASTAPSDISQSSHDKPVQPSRSTVTFPLTLYGSKKRSFNPSWYSDFQWLEYSVERNRAFCFACRHFTTGGARSETSFTKDRFGDWKHALDKNGILQGHPAPSYLKDMMEHLCYPQKKSSQVSKTRGKTTAP